MKYKKHIATGALAISLLVGGSPVFAVNPRDLGIKNTQPTYQKENRNHRNFGYKSKHKGNIVGSISAISGSGFTVEVKNMKTQVLSSLDVATDTTTKYTKNGIAATTADLAVGKKVIVIGNLDKTTNILTAKIVKIVK